MKDNINSIPQEVQEVVDIIEAIKPLQDELHCLISMPERAQNYHQDNGVVDFFPEKADNDMYARILVSDTEKEKYISIKDNTIEPLILYNKITWQISCYIHDTQGLVKLFAIYSGWDIVPERIAQLKEPLMAILKAQQAAA